MESKMLSLENISVVNSAIFISLLPRVKREILCVTGSEYDTSKSKYQYYRKAQWVEIVKRKAKEILKRELPENLQSKVISILPAIAFRMLIWAEYHEELIELDRSYSFNFLRHSHFTLQGTIDDKKAAEDMIMDINLSVKQRYKLSCFYCFPKYISSFFKKIVRTKKTMQFGPEDYRWMETPDIVRQWTFQMTGAVDERREEMYTPRYIRGLLRSIKCGSKEGVKHFWEDTYLISREYALLFGATEVLGRINEHQDWIVFKDKTFSEKESWVPTYFYVDILCFLLSNMTKSQQRKALKQNIKGSGTQFSPYDPITVLELFLCWPCQKYFMKTAKVLWDLIPSDTYAVILLKICDKIEPSETHLLYGEEKCYDYAKLLIDFWSQSPYHFKRYVFSDVPIVYSNCAKVKTTTGIGLLLKLISLNKFTYEHKEIVWVILESASVEERTHLTSAKTWSSTCISILKKEKYEIFDRLLQVICKSEEEISEFKKTLDLYKVTRTVCRNFLNYGKMNAVKSLIKRMSFPEYQLCNLKEDIIYSAEGKNCCWKILSSGRIKHFEEYIEWFFPSKKREILFKKHLDSLIYQAFPVKFPSDGVPDFISSFTRSKLPNIQAIKKIQTDISDTFGRSICEDLIAGSSSRFVYNESDSSLHVKNEFWGGQWERVNKFLSWSIPTKKKLHDFKEAFFKESGDVIHFNLIKKKKWKEAERFFVWLGLCHLEIRKLKERALFGGICWWHLHYLVFDLNDEIDNLEEIDLLLRWHLIEKSITSQFRDYFLKYNEDWDKAGLKKFNMLIENYLDDLDKEGLNYKNTEEHFFRYLDGGGLKRKSSVFPQQKKIRLSLDGEVLQNEKTGNSSRCKEII